jgi:hypothetical protein
MSKHWSGLPYLDALRPDPGWVVDRAVLTTYSADLVAVVAALLALAGLDDDRGSGSKVDFANAHEQLRDRVRILVQAGRIALPAKKLAILSILDGFIREVYADESQGSWHPKAALIRLRSEDDVDRSEWRLWIGSRNLTRSLDWDAGLVLTGRSSDGGQPVLGVAELGAELASLARLADFVPERVQQELERVRWQSPKGVTVDELRLFTPNGRRGLPAQPDNIKKLVVISPFIDGTTIQRLGRWGNKKTERLLLSTLPELTRLHTQAGRPLTGFQQLLSLDVPEQEGDTLPAEDATEESEVSSEDEEIESRGLHAKLIYAERAEGGGMLWLGSANTTGRGWEGPNTEVVAQLRIEQVVAEGLNAFLEEVASTIDVSTLPEIDELEPEEEWLEEARKQVAARWEVTQQRHPKGPLLLCDQPPHPDREDIELEVGLLACDLVPWPRRQKQLQLPPIPQARETELIQVQLRLGPHRCTWLQRAPLDPPPDEERDRRALARYLDPRTFLLWIRALLSAEDIGDGGGEWDTEPAPVTRPGSTAVRLMWWAPTLEEVLKAWSRDPDRLQIIDRKVEHYLKLMQEQPDIEHSEEEERVLEEFQATWRVIRQVLVSEAA